MAVKEHTTVIMKEIEEALIALDYAACDRLAERIVQAKRIFLAGAGRSGLVIRTFAMRLMHLGLEAFVVGETTAPAIAGADLLLIGSGSGETQSLVAMARRAKEIKAEVALVTIHPRSSIGELSDLLVRIPATTPKSSRPPGGASEQAKGSLFEQTMFLLLEAIVLRLMERLGIDSQQMFCRHANLE